MGKMLGIKIKKGIIDRETQAVDIYLSEVNKIEMITPEQEVILTQKIIKGDEQALHKLVRANLRFVISVAKQYLHQGLPLSDLINEGNMGLIKAAGRYDETKGFKFISYAVWWIRQAILQALADHGRIVRLPLNKIGIYNKANRAYNSFEQANEREPSTEELAELMEISESYVIDVFNTNTRHTSLDHPIHEEGNITLGDLLKNDDEKFKPDNATEKESLAKDIDLALSRLSEKQRDVVKMYCGINCEAMTLDSIADHYNRTRENIRQTVEKAIHKIRNRPSSMLLLMKHLG